MNKDDLRDKLLIAKEQYVNKNATRLDKIRPIWDKVQATVPEIKTLEPYIEFCTNNDLWWYSRVSISSAPLSGEVGRRIHYLVRDKKTGFVIGIVGLSSDLTIPIRDEHIGWTRDNKWKDKRINYLMNVQHCVATPELSNYLTAKLCALSVLSSEVQEHFENKYHHPLAMMTVTSLFGKSSVYNRLTGFTYLGTTKGYSIMLIPLEVKQQMREDFKANKGKYSEIYYNEDGTIKERYGVVKGYQKLSKYADVQRVENVRGVYVIPLAENYKEFLCKETDILEPLVHPPFESLVGYWKERWCLPRVQRIRNGLV